MACDLLADVLSQASSAVELLWKLHPNTLAKNYNSEEKARVVRFATNMMAWEGVCMETKLFSAVELAQRKREICKVVRLRAGVSEQRRRGRGRRGKEPINLALFVNRAMSLYRKINELKPDEGLDLLFEQRVQLDAAMGGLDINKEKKEN